MSKWLDFKQDNVDVDMETGCVDILVDRDYDGAVYLSIPVADIKAIYSHIRVKEQEQQEVLAL